MRVLVAGFDLFRSVGGGQTFYRSVIQANSDIEFCYLQDREPDDVPRPANARPLRYRAAVTQADLQGFAEPGPPAWAHHDFVTANNVARAAAGQRFDVVDTPDYERSGVFLPAALRRHGVGFRKLAVSMHGGLSTTMHLNWEAPGTPAEWLVRLEMLQYQAADVRYFISEMYRSAWRAAWPGESQYLDPMWFFRPPARSPYTDSPAPPALYFVGRTERIKGPHLFLDVAWWLPRDSYSAAVVVGPDSHGRNGTPTSDILRRMIENRQLDGVAELAGPMGAADLARVFASKAVLVLPSLVDSLNLVALEALFSGCPTVVGTAAGVCGYLRDRFPGVPFVPFDAARFHAGLAAVEDLLRNYDRRRIELEDAVRAADLTPVGPRLADVYRAESSADPAARAECEDWDRRLAAACGNLARAG